MQPQVISLNQLPRALAKLGHPLLEVTLGIQDDPESIFISSLL